MERDFGAWSDARHGAHSYNTKKPEDRVLGIQILLEPRVVQL
uniref:Uncharacterized protein n=1 Tax=Rhizobium leguminosarum bv. viciae TaxID=387 RepID=A0A0U2YV80_RHILV|nr:hypothetical protein [Rhizobium leguminosarum bv. viciae]